jgi:internalin A
MEKRLKTIAILVVVSILVATLAGCGAGGPEGDTNGTQGVIFPDPNLEEGIRHVIGKPDGPIYSSDLEGLTSLGSFYAPGVIIDLTGLEHCTSLTYLQLGHNGISDISPLSSLDKLRTLGLYWNQIQDISPLSSLANLTSLNLWRNQIADISPLSDLTSLIQLSLADNQIRDITPLSHLVNLGGQENGFCTIDLDLSENQISDIAPLSNLSNLEALLLGNNRISDISPLSNLTRLYRLDLNNNQISDITALSSLTRLDSLDLECNQISDISSLSELANLRTLYLGSNNISDISPLSQLIGLDWLVLGSNNISDLSPLADLIYLSRLDLSNNQISDISPLRNLTNLGGSTMLYPNLDLRGNQISDIEPLVANAGLFDATVDLRDNPLSHDSINVYIPQLEARGVEVLWSPTFQPNQTEFTNQEILEAVYSDYKYPRDFYQEDLEGGSLYYENTISVKPIFEREHRWIELCTDDRNQALEWSEASSKNSAYYRDLIDERETEKYFEFERVYSENPFDIILSRVHKSSYLDRSSYDRFEKGSVLGIFNQRPITPENAKELTEYLWFVENYNIVGSKVLSSFTEDQGNSIKHTIYETHVVYGDWGMSDQITLIKSEYVVDKNSGQFTLSQKHIRTVTGRYHELKIS